MKKKCNCENPYNYYFAPMYGRVIIYILPTYSAKASLLYDFGVGLSIKFYVDLNDMN